MDRRKATKKARPKHTGGKVHLNRAKFGHAPVISWFEYRAESWES